MSSASHYLEELFGLTGRTAVVVGGTGVLGGAICHALGKAGAHVVVVGRNREHGESAVASIQGYGGSAEFAVCEATSREDLERLVSDLAAQGRHCDILVNGAGVNSPTPFLEITDDE